MSGALSFGVFPAPQVAPFEELVGRSRRAEALGFDSLWLADQTPMAYPGIIGFEAWSTLGAIARETSRIRLGTLVSPPAMRHPLVLAMAVSTVDHASGGRVTLGMGAGGDPKDLAGLGLPAMTPRRLVDHLGAGLDIVDRLLRGETVTVTDGAEVARDAVVERPVQSPRPPILVAAHGPRTIGLAARHADTWNCLGGQPISGPRLEPDDALASARHDLEALDRACERIGRDPASIRRSVFAFRASLFVTEGAAGAWVERYRAAGFEEFIFIWPGAGPEQAARVARLERFARETMPGLRVAG